MANIGPLRQLIGSDPILFIRFVIVGVLNTAFSFGAYALFLFVGLNYAVASLLALIAGIFWSFQTMGRLAFQSRLRGRFHLYVLVWAVLYGVNVGLIAMLMGIGLNAYIAGLLSLVPTASLGFLMQKRYVFAAPNSNTNDR